MKKFVLDTNLYVHAFRDRSSAGDLQAFLAAFTPSTFLSSIVVHELLVGANTPAKAAEIRKAIVAPLERVGRVITPGHAAWVEAGSALATMARKDGRDLRTVPKSLVNDFLLASSCREAGATLLTDNVADFRMIRHHVRFEFEAPWPA